MGQILTSLPFPRSCWALQQQHRLHWAQDWASIFLAVTIDTCRDNIACRVIATFRQWRDMFLGQLTFTLLATIRAAVPVVGLHLIPLLPRKILNRGIMFPCASSGRMASHRFRVCLAISFRACEKCFVIFCQIFLLMCQNVLTMSQVICCFLLAPFFRISFSLLCLSRQNLLAISLIRSSFRLLRALRIFLAPRLYSCPVGFWVNTRQNLLAIFGVIRPRLFQPCLVIFCPIFCVFQAQFFSIGFSVFRLGLSSLFGILCCPLCVISRIFIMRLLTGTCDIVWMRCCPESMIGTDLFRIVPIHFPPFTTKVYQLRGVKQGRLV